MSYDRKSEKLKETEKDFDSVLAVDRNLVSQVGDLNAGILLSRIHKLLSDGDSISHQGREWVTWSRKEWQDEICLSPRQFDRALQLLVKRNRVLTKKTKYMGKVAILIRPIQGKECNNVNMQIAEQ